MSNDNQDKKFPDKVPMLPVRDIVVFPYMILPLYVGRESSIKAVEEALSKDRMIFLASQKEVTEENPNFDSIHKTGTVAMIMRMRKLSDGRIKILIQGMSKATINELSQTEPYFEAKIEKVETNENKYEAEELEPVIRTVKEKLEKIIALGKLISPDILLVLEDVKEPGRLADLITGNLNLKIEDSQKVLESNDAKERLLLVDEILTAELEVLEMQTKIKNTAKDEMSKTQREYFLREQMRAIKNELGENDSKSEENDELRKQLINAGMPEDVEAEAIIQLNRLERMHPDASEASMVRTYLDWMIALPWNVSTEDVLDLKKSKEILDEDHYDLEKAKDRILEFLAVRKLNKNNLSGPILCFAGPPGVGKTSLGKSIARSMGRKYFRVSLGGVKDEAEIRGHRRTYVGAMPGKIVQALKQVGSNNAVIVLDEIDKLGSDFRGDPSAAMLEVLDPEQNSTFRDNYLNVDFDLSNVLFLATANVLDNIPAALRDRMEIIHISGYTENDKAIIAKKHLVKGQIKDNGLNEDQISFTDEGLSYLISHYTREAGLRNLKRVIGSVCRKVAKNVVMGLGNKYKITKDTVTELLGAPHYLKEEALKENQVGITTGLAWTQAGGQILYVEAIKMKGKGGLILTGQLGDVMKESARAAMSYAKANAKGLGIDEEWFNENEVHIHLPAGAIPKDGPSAGVTMSTSLISLMTDTPIRKDVCMTGEVTLTGRVLPVGGIKEKVLAALSYDIKTVIVPISNKKDVDEIPSHFKEGMNFIFVENIDEVIAVAFDKSAKVKSKKSGTGKKGSKKKDIAAAA